MRADRRLRKDRSRSRFLPVTLDTWNIGQILWGERDRECLQCSPSGYGASQGDVYMSDILTTSFWHFLPSNTCPCPFSTIIALYPYFVAITNKSVKITVYCRNFCRQNEDMSSNNIQQQPSLTNKLHLYTFQRWSWQQRWWHHREIEPWPESSGSREISGHAPGAWGCPVGRWPDTCRSWWPPQRLGRSEPELDPGALGCGERLIF